MDCRLICQWLGLPPTPWPPDHYTLLGLPPGEADAARIEQHAQERLQRLRCYQISHAEQATEAMNRLAQALVCLTDPAAKHRYDAGLGLGTNGPPALPPPSAVPGASTNGPKALAPAAAVLPAGTEETAVNAPQTRLDWHVTPPPVRVPPPEPAAPATQAPAAPAVVEAVPPPAPAGPPPVLPSRPAGPVLDAARTSPEARRGLGTRRALYQRLLATRELLRAWDLAGRYLARPNRKLVKAAEATDLVRRLARVERLLPTFPPLLGQAGQPGYRVVMLAREEHVARAFKDLPDDGREALALDWKVGRAVLVGHLKFVRDRARAVRRQGPVKRALRAASAAINDHPGWVVAGTVLALLLALLSIAKLF